MEQDDTPAENGWFYRRWYTFISSIGYMGIALIAALRMDDATELKWVVLAVVGAKVVIDGLYLAGASVLDYAKLAASWKGNNKNE